MASMDGTRQEKEAAMKREREEALQRAEKQMTDLERPETIVTLS